MAASAGTTLAGLQDYETFHPDMKREEILDWFQKRLGRTPVPVDVFAVAKDFYQLGAYSRALQCCMFYLTMPNTAASGRHLLAYCYLGLNEHEKALTEFKRCVKDGYHDDWQLIVELTIDIDKKRALEMQHFKVVEGDDQE